MTPFAHAFAYAIKKTPYAFFAKITLCMYILCGIVERIASHFWSVVAENQSGTQISDREPITELYNIWRKHAPPSLKQKTWRELVPADANWSRLLVVTTDQKGNAKLQTKVFAPLVVSKK